MTAIARNFVKDAGNVGQGEPCTLTSPGCAIGAHRFNRGRKILRINRSGDTNEREIHSEADSVLCRLLDARNVSGICDTYESIPLMGSKVLIT